MELRHYWRIIWDRRLLVIGVTLVALILSIVSVATLPQPLPSYSATVQFGVRPGRFPVESYQQYGEYYLFLASEFLNDDIINLVESGGFNDVLKSRMADRPEGPPAGSIEGTKAHRLITFTVSSERGSDAMDMARGIIELLTEPREGEPRYLELFSEQDPRITVIDPPRLTSQPGVRRGALDVAMRTILGLIVGLGLTFLLYYLDDTVRDRREAERQLDLPVLGEIPASGGRKKARASA